MEEIIQKIDWEILDRYIRGNLIVANKHPEYDIWVLNYSPKVQAQGLWDEYTLSCRGMVVNAAGDILARPFKKFKNIEDYSAEEIPADQEFEIFEKIDGSLIVVFYYEPYMEWIVSARGSFITEQATEARKMLDNNQLKKLNIDQTYLFELIYPENRIVVDYGLLRDLILIASISNKTGYEITFDTLNDLYSPYFTVVQRHDLELTNFHELKDLEEDNQVGFVVRFKNGFRMNIKFAGYLKVQAVVTNLSNLTLWEHLKNGFDFDELVDRVPDEFYKWIRATIANIKGEYRYIELKAYKEFFNLFYLNGITKRTEFASSVENSEYKTILFKLYDKRAYDILIWNMIKPEYSVPFKNGYVNY